MPSKGSKRRRQERREGQGGPPVQQREELVSPSSSFQHEVDVEKLASDLQNKLALAPLPQKPKPGILGRKIELVSNCFPIVAPSGNVYHYDVEILLQKVSKTMHKPTASTAPDAVERKDAKYTCLSTKRNREVINEMLRIDENFQDLYPVYDGRKNLYTRTPLSIGEKLKCEVVLENSPRKDIFQVLVKPVKKKDANDFVINLDSLHALFAGRCKSVPEEAIMALETILRHSPCLKFVPVGRSFFYPPEIEKPMPLGKGKELWFGYHQSLRLTQWMPTVNLDVTATAFYQEGPLLDYMTKFLGINESRLNQTTLNIQTKSLSDDLKNVKVRTTHTQFPRIRRIYKFTDVGANRLKLHNSEMTVEAYFSQTYGRLKFPNLPCVQVSPKEKHIYLPVEVCEVVGRQPCIRLNPSQQADMIKFTAKPPKERFAEIDRVLQSKAEFNKDPILRNFSMKVLGEALTVTGRTIEAPNIIYKNDRRIRPREGSWNMRGTQFLEGATISSWVLLSFEEEHYCRRRNLEDFAKSLCRFAGEQGIRIERANDIQIKDPSSNVKSILQDIKRKSIELLIIVLPGGGKVNRREAEEAARKTAISQNLYKMIKNVAETEIGLITQCIKAYNVVENCTPSLISNVLLKINAKMGGINNSLNEGEIPRILRESVMLFGADVNHAGPVADDESKPSIAAVIGSLPNSRYSRYAVSIRQQYNEKGAKATVEEIKDMKSMVIELLQAYEKNGNGQLPSKIIFYRDGVSDGQFGHVRNHEIKGLKEACRIMRPDYNPGLTYIVVQKRHHVRFKPQNDLEGVGRMRNAPPGTTVDTTITHPLNFDFFLISQCGLIGTSRPAYYVVLQDENKFSQDDLQKLTYQLCHIFVRCTKSISLPVPVQYAHLAAYRARLHLADFEKKQDTQGGKFHKRGQQGATGGKSSLLPSEVAKAITVLDVMKDKMYYA